MVDFMKDVSKTADRMEHGRNADGSVRLLQVEESDCV